MSKISTLIYLVNGFQQDLNSTTQEEVDCFSGEQFTEELEPSQRSIDNIMNFAHSFEVLETETTGYVEMILN